MFGWISNYISERLSLTYCRLNSICCMSDLTQIQRTLKILQWLSAGQRMTTRELERRFDGRVKLRTIQRDLGHIRNSGVPLRVERGLGNEGYWSLERFAMGFVPQFLEKSELLAAMILKSNLRIFTDTTFQNEIDDLMSKLDQIVPDHLFEDVSKMHIFENYAVGELDYSGMSAVIEDLFKAIMDKHPCTVTYQGLEAESPKTYDVTPVKMLLYQGALYVVTYIRKYENFIILNLSRIQRLSVQDTVDKNMPEFKLEEMRESQFGVFQAKQTQRVILEFLPAAVPHIIGRCWHSSQQVTNHDDGRLTLELDVGITPELVSWIQGWIPHVHVAEPNTLKEEVLIRLTKGIEAHSNIKQI